MNTVYDYHQRTKHRFNAYAKGPDFLDWDTQPNPYRRFAGSPLITLPLAAEHCAVTYPELFEGRIPPSPFTIHSLGLLLELSFGLSAIKQYGEDQWALRCNPSSGNLHPTEVYVIANGVPDLASGVYHYASYEHGLELRCQADWPQAGIWVGFSSIHWREAWKYGERAFRYCQHDIGHALGALRYAAAVLGWRVEWQHTMSDAELAAVLGVDRDMDFMDAEPETPDLLVRLVTERQPDAATTQALMPQHIVAGNWHGQANRLSAHHLHHWPIIDTISQATRKPRTQPAPQYQAQRPAPTCADPAHSAARLILQRRSAQSFDKTATLSLAAFLRMMESCLPHTDRPPFDVWPWPPRVHLLLFVHRVESLAPGLYLLFRDESTADRELTRLPVEYTRIRVTQTPKLPLYKLIESDFIKTAKILSCQQAIAGDSAFSLGMLAEFDTALACGPWGYRHLYWETGLIGQSLYLEAEASGVRGTGIGCFFDDAVHEVLKLGDTHLQSLYHFTVGTPLPDTRLQTLPAYAHRVLSSPLPQ